MTILPRRGFLAGAGSASLLAACGNGVGSTGATTIDARVDQTLNFMYSKYPGTRDLADKASGMLVMPVVTKAGLGFGASYGRGALRVNGATVDYYSAASGTVGFQIGAAQYSHVLFFMTPEALSAFRRSPGWVAGADIEYVLKENGENLSADTTTTLSPVIAVIFGQAGLIAGATLKGTKYTRIIP
ncbi:YSC84-related protein [Pseudoruegeria sp. HB172150]|uniref:lipid-binding SYLF domain-containing protein n=1 Tax=Pseudoruegeria sp. HB172150 TaxID=2721164 RepID=UPI0015517E29|nr:YSC84-related protein [Pseudoruegeria sp. HB172150]